METIYITKVSSVSLNALSHVLLRFYRVFFEKFCQHLLLSFELVGSEVDFFSCLEHHFSFIFCFTSSRSSGVMDANFCCHRARQKAFFLSE